MAGLKAYGWEAHSYTGDRECKAMRGTGVKQSSVTPDPTILESVISEERVLAEQEILAVRKWQAEHLRLLWSSRWLLLRATAVGLLALTLTPFLIPNSSTSPPHLIHPHTHST